MYENNIYFLDEINNLRTKDKDLLISMSEEMYHNQIEEVVEKIIAKSTIKIVLIAGPSSAGKTTTSMLVSKNLYKYNKKPITISLDDFFLNRDKTPKLPNGKLDYESINALDLDYFNSFINNLFTKKEALMPKYNFITGKREEKFIPITLTENSILIIEGLHALNPTLINENENKIFKIYLNILSSFKFEETVITNNELRLMRRLIRDFYTRGRSVSDTYYTWQEVLDGEQLYIDPYKSSADAYIDTTHMYEPLLYAKYLNQILLEDKSELSLTLVDKLKDCLTLGKQSIPQNSLLNEFIPDNLQ